MVGFALSELGLEEESVGDRDVLAAPEAGDDCPPSALLRQIEGLHERRMSGSS